MFEQSTICPYTGLRSFNEDESLYFEGREQQITDITKLLEKNHFLMVTGASGDGKSSIVYAGIIPNARAGFFKSRFPNWIIADFRPEKSPLKNFAKSVSKALNIPKEETVETEIRRGFSSLIDLYKNSKYYVDESSPDWLQANEITQKERLKNGANLIILVDQFEEFFTTQENFLHGVPSQESHTTLNVILETAKLALKEGIPIYTICTMRSDYIGQCSAFRGLPEYIGFSQFFVPRLKRNQLQRVIEEPAKLSGNSISRRLVERLIYDLNEGVDQLPILQHALNQIWRVADEGKEEMDLIHYAMVGGMPANELPDADQERFLSWYRGLPEYQRKSYKTPSLNNVLDIHANKLYEGAATEYNKHYAQAPITIGEAKRAVALTFACLTRMDEGRGVRNRMTLQDVTNIINNPELDVIKVGRLLKIFRREGNTFIRPFIFNAEDEKDLDADVVLDITHESLIRNWQRLERWAVKEYEYYETYLDFKKQLDRWLNNQESRSYLLPVGPLSFFENWYEECKPNAYWINRYEDSLDNPEEKLNHSKYLLEKSKLFLKKSANKHLLAKAFMKYGARNIAIAIGIISTVLLSSFYYRDAVKKQNANIIKELFREGEKHINNEAKLANFLDTKNLWMVMALFNDPNKALEIVNNISSPKVKLQIPIGAYQALLNTNPFFKGWEKDSLIQISHGNIIEVLPDTSVLWSTKMGQINQFVSNLVHDKTFDDTDDIDHILQNQINLLKTSILNILSSDPSYDINIADEIYSSIQHINNFDDQPSDFLNEMVTLLSPFEASGKENFNHYFPASVRRNNGEEPLTHNGTYHLFAEVYASLGIQDRMFLSIDQITANNRALGYVSFETFNTIYQVFGYLVKNNHQHFFDPFLEYVESKFQIGGTDFCRKFLARSGNFDDFNLTTMGNFHQNHPGQLNTILSHLSPKQMEVFFEFASKVISRLEDLNERNYFTALFLKQRALLLNDFLLDKNEYIDTSAIDQLLIESFEYYDQIADTYLQEEINLMHHYYGDGIRRITQKKGLHFLYPDLFAGEYIGERYLNGYFIDFLKRNPRYQGYYDDQEKLNLFIDWIYHAHEQYPTRGGFLIEDFQRIENKLTTDQKEFVHEFLSNSTYQDDLDFNLLNLVICNAYYKIGDTTNASKYFNQLNLNQFNSSGTRGEYLNITFFFNQVVDLATHHAKLGHKVKVHKLIRTISEVHFRMQAYFKIARHVHNSDFPEHTYHYLEHGFNALELFDPGPLNFSNYYKFIVIETVAGLGSRELDVLADDELKKLYPNGARNKMIGRAKRGKYYQAIESIPASNTIPQDLSYHLNLLYLDSNQKDNPKWEAMVEKYDTYGLTNLEYILFATF